MYTVTTTNTRTLDSHTIRYESLSQLPVFILERIRGQRMPLSFLGRRGRTGARIYFHIKGPHA